MQNATFLVLTLPVIAGHSTTTSGAELQLHCVALHLHCRMLPLDHPVLCW